MRNFIPLLIILAACGGGSGPAPAAKLDGLTVSAGALMPAFDSEVTEYRVDAMTQSEMVTVQPLAPGSGLEVLVDGTTVDPNQPIPLPIGESRIEVIVTRSGLPDR